MVPGRYATLIQFSQIYGFIYSVFILALTIVVIVSFINSLIDYYLYSSTAHRSYQKNYGAWRGLILFCVYIYTPKMLSFNELSKNTPLSFRNLEVTVSCLVLDKLNVFKLQCRAESFNLKQNKTE
jgi:hypothetical protein